MKYIHEIFLNFPICGKTKKCVLHDMSGKCIVILKISKDMNISNYEFNNLLIKVNYGLNKLNRNIKKIESFCQKVIPNSFLSNYTILYY